MTAWFFILALPCLAFGLAAVLSPAWAQKALVRFPRQKALGGILCLFGWLFTAYEVDTIGIEVFDRIVRRLWFLPFEIPGAVWILALVLTVLTCLWMANLLPIRALSALLMLYPAELFVRVRLCETPLRLTLVTFAYLSAAAGMFGMFYPWRIRQAWAWIAAGEIRTRVYGGFFAAWGGLFLALGIVSALGLIR